MFPVWLGFRGGKGVATALGVLIALAWPVALGRRRCCGSRPRCSSTIPRLPRWSPRSPAPRSPRSVADKRDGAADRRYRLVNHRCGTMRTSAGCWPAPRAGSLSAKAEARPGRARTRSAGAPRLAAPVPHRDDRPGDAFTRCCAASARPARRWRWCRSSRGAASAPRP